MKVCDKDLLKLCRDCFALFKGNGVLLKDFLMIEELVVFDGYWSVCICVGVRVG